MAYTTNTTTGAWAGCSARRQIFNILGCIFVVPAVCLLLAQSLYPFTLDLLVNIILAEYNRFANERRRKSAGHVPRGLIDDSGFTHTDKKKDLEMLPIPTKNECLAAVVGYREDPVLFTQALESYKTARGHVFMCVGIDGDTEDDQEMVDVFNKVYPHRSLSIHLAEPLGEVAERVRRESLALQRKAGGPIDQEKSNREAMQHCLQLVRAIIDKEIVGFGGVDGIRHLCIQQRHLHKKGIMFTTFVFSLVIAEILGVEFLWSSDSDTLVFEDSLERTISTMADDHTVGGASAGLTVHNSKDTIVTRLSAAVYWVELYLTRSTSASAATSDCQSGPSSAFRLACLPDILVPWYMQTVLGQRMIVNEDRHLTTNLLLRGWSVVFASDVLAATETPTTMARWLRQQVRWARATHIESLLMPQVYLTSHPVLFYSAVRREFGPMIVAIAMALYFLTSMQLIFFRYSDLFWRVVILFAYNMLRNPDRLRDASLLALPALIFYNVPLPAVHLWSLLTLKADTWGTTMRANGEMSKRDSIRKQWGETGFFVVWMGIVGGAVAKSISHHLHLPWLQAFALMLAATSASSFGAWKVTITDS